MNPAKWLSPICAALIVGNAFATGAVSGKVGAPPSARKAVRRLPPNVVPSYYRLNLKPNLENATFSGSEDVTLKVSPDSSGKQPSQILVNAKELRVSNAVLTDSKGKKTRLLVQSLPADEMVALRAPASILPGEYHLSLDFGAKLNEKLVGFYHSVFKDSSGKTHNLAVTQFEPTDARRMFPCFDEPVFKAHYKIAVETRKQYAAISNAAVEKETVQANGVKVVQFAETPPMSSYLVAVLVGEFEPTPAITVDGVPVRVWSIKGKSNLGQYSRDEAAKLLPTLTNYFKIPYPWGKLDLIAIPDFEAGAMENPGCITFRETLLLIDPKTASTSAFRGATGVIAHEMAHLWFGDLVTMKWWDDLWLNEAFATWMATKATDAVHPDWQMWKDYAADRAASLATDSLHSTRAIHADVSNPEQAREMFDEITYEKGCSILRMLERYVGENTFQSGIHNYLSEHSFKNATTADLWAATDAAWRTAGGSGEKIQQTMDTWVQQPGYPLVTIGHAGDKLALRQQRFFQLHQAGDAGNKQLWSAPIGFRALAGAAPENKQSEAQHKFLMSGVQLEIARKDAYADSAYVANAGGVGYYRVKYPEADFALLKERAEKELDPSERLVVLDDAWALAKAGDTPITDFLDLSQSFSQDTDDVLWGSLLHDIAYLDDFVDADKRAAYESYVRDELSYLMKTLGWQPKADESQQTRLLRSEVIATLGTLGQDKETISHARALFAEYIKGKEVDRDILGPITAIVAYNGNAADYAQIKKLYQTAKTPEIEHRNLFALSAFASPQLVQQTMNMAISGSVRIQDAPHLLGSLLGDRRSRQPAWSFIQQHWPRIVSLYSQEMVPRMVSRASSFNTADLSAQLTSFVASHPMPMGQTTIKRTIERTEVNVQFRKTQMAPLNAWLKQHFSKG